MTSHLLQSPMGANVFFGVASMEKLLPFGGARLRLSRLSLFGMTGLFCCEALKSEPRFLGFPRPVP